MGKKVEKIDMAIFIAKAQDVNSQGKSEFDRYRLSLGEIETTTVNWRPVLFYRLHQPPIAIVTAYDKIKYFQPDKEWRTQFIKEMERIIGMMPSAAKSPRIAICAHWGISYEAARNSSWQECHSFMRKGLPENWRFTLLSSSRDSDYAMGIGGNGPIRIPNGGEFDSWFTQRLA